ncbi:sigma-54-dependent Fis family transcriptional regulator [Mangrovicella endophytica]|uniref:sigma-54-dependent Fis family transcriptional regulator n=1 Tax=Mangrovicella endophytica TaxID=2066697 RepID=UPI0018E4BB83|nr:sigma-54-dependent Fis family transcriptional regulator [Mangrovicella endophytica]
MSPRSVTLTHHEMREHREPLDEVINAAKEELDYIWEPLSAAGFGASFSNTAGLILYYRSDREAGNFVESERSGTLWAEGVSGTNGVGTCVIERRPTQVFKNEHFFHDYSKLSCAAAPILSAEAEMIGVLNFTTGNPDIRRETFDLVGGLVVKSAERLSDHLFRHRFRDRTILMGRAANGVMLLALDEDRIIGANYAARQSLGWDGAIQPVSIASILGDRETTAPLAGGRPINLQIRDRSVSFDILEARPLLARRAGRPPLIEGRKAEPAAAAKPAKPSLPAVEDCLGSDPAHAPTLRLLRKISGSALPILILGETGVGKDTLARAIHRDGSRRDKSFVAFNCAAMPETLIDAELFGYAEGAFTGARRTGNRGRVAEADGGILFLDEIGDMPLALQTRLLRVLETGEVSPLGSGTTRHVDVQVIAATNQDLKARVAAGLFRQDLYYRIAGVVVLMPPLRQRPDASSIFDAVLAAVSGETPITLSEAARSALQAHDWPGNVRELKHVLHRAVHLCEDGVIQVGDLALDGPAAGTRPAAAEIPTSAPAATIQDAAAIAERALILETLRRLDGNVDAAAKTLNVSRATLYRKLRFHKLRPQRF